MRDLAGNLIPGGYIDEQGNVRDQNGRVMLGGYYDEGGNLRDFHGNIVPGGYIDDQGNLVDGNGVIIPAGEAYKNAKRHKRRPINNGTEEHSQDFSFESTPLGPDTRKGTQSFLDAEFSNNLMNEIKKWNEDNHTLEDKLAERLAAIAELEARVKKLSKPLPKKKKIVEREPTDITPEMKDALESLEKKNKSHRVG